MARAVAATAFAILCASASTAAAAIEVSASVDRNLMARGEQVILSIEVQGAQNAPAPAITGLDGFSAAYIGPSTQVSFVNGQMSASVTHRYQLVAEREGRFRIGPFELDVEGRRYTTNAIQVQVSAAPQAQAGGGGPGESELELVVQVPKNELYVGERVPLEIALFVGNVRVDDLQYPAIAGEGVVVDKLGEPSRRNEVAGGKRYQVLRFSTKLSAVRPGPVELSATMGMNQLVSRRRGGDQFFDQFFSGAFAERRSIQVQADPRSLNVLGLPEEGRPADFTGAVGRFDFEVTAQPTDLAAGDPVTMRMAIRGDGDLSRVEAPQVATDDRFRKYDPQVAKGEASADQKVFEQVLIPKKDGAVEIPELRFSFFDPERRSYATISRGPFPLTVRPAPAGEEPRIVAENAPERAAAPEKLGRDIVFIKSMPGDLRPRGAFYRGVLFVSGQLLAPLGFAALFASARRRERLAADPRLARSRRAGREARQLLAALEGAGAQNAFYDRLTVAMHAYLAAKLDLPPGAVERARVLERIGTEDQSAELRKSVGDLFDLLEQARYARSAGPGDGHEPALRLAKDIVERLERRPRASAWGGRALVIGLLCAGMAAFAEEPTGAVDAHATFFLGNTAYQEGRYEDAAAAYEKVLAAGVESGELYFNLGNAYFKLGRIGRAILNYERARRSLPRDPDVRANLSYARESAGDAEDAAPLWRRIVFAPAERATSGELAAATSLAWFLLWGIAAWRIAAARMRDAATRALWVVLALFVVVGANFGHRVRQLELTPRSVVVAAGETPVRFEPSNTGTEHFRVREGAVLEVTDQRDGWAQIRRPDGRRGWLAADALGVVDPAAAG